MQAEIISIGDEILIGQTVNTNATWMGEQLNSIGIRVHRVTSIADDASDIKAMLDESLSRSEIVLITGGLGPTKDDITKKTLCEYFDSKLILNQESLDRVSAFFESRGLPMLEINHQQAMVPEVCTVLHNLRGTANGMWFEKDGKIIVSMPGVPYEMQWLMETEVLPRVQIFFQRPAIVHRTILTSGVGESFLADKIKDWEDSLAGENIKLAYLPSPGMVKLRMSAYGGDSESALQEKIARKEKELLEIIGEHIYGYEKETLSSIVGDRLKSQNATISSAESCTGGMISHLITSTPGSSNYFKGSIVSYAEDVKMEELGVTKDLIAKYGVYSTEVAEAMAIGVRNAIKTTYSVASTGVAGPDDDGGVKVGTIWIAAAGPNGVVSEQLRLGRSRERNILMASNAALNLLRKNFLK
ncbi:MAG: competence/damage-inducible protein A [Flavobacteriales bacterium]